MTKKELSETYCSGQERIWERIQTKPWHSKTKSRVTRVRMLRSTHRRITQVITIII